MPTAGWKIFERLVHFIEQVLAPEGAVVTLDDHIPDVDTGEPRQVDASIRMKLGSGDVLIIVECRDRSRRQDARWIEEIAEKRWSVRADKAIAVSSRGFYDSAKKKARARNIELRTVSEIDESTVRSWFAGGTVLQTQVTFGTSQLLFTPFGDDTRLRFVETRNSDGSQNDEALYEKKVFEWIPDGLLVSVSDLCSQMEGRFKRSIWRGATTAPDGTWRREVRISFDPGVLRVTFQGQALEIALLRAKLWQRRVSSQVVQPKIMEYADLNDRVIAQALEWKFQHDGRDLGAFRVVRDVGKGTTTGFVVGPAEEESRKTKK